MTISIGAEVTFGGSGFDRAANLRGEADVLRLAQGHAGSRTILFWRGYVLTDGGAVARLACDHPVLAEADPVYILLGREDDALVFARDISAWEPEEGGQPEPGPGRAASDLPRHPALADGLAFADLRAVMAGLSPRDAELAATAKALYGWHLSHRFCARCGAQSEMIEAGWQRRCPVCNARHFPRTDPVVIMLITRGNRTLLGRSPGWPEGMYSLLAGFVEPGETIEAAVRREVMEEAGVPVGAVRYLCDQPWPFPASLMFGCHGVAEADEITLDPVELEDALWITREEAADVVAGVHPRIRKPRQGAIAEFILRNWLADRLE